MYEISREKPMEKFSISKTMGRNRVFARPLRGGMSLHLVTQEGKTRFLSLHRYNSDLYAFLRDGKTIDSIYRYKPGRSKRKQKLYSSLRHIAKLAQWVETYENAA